MNSIRDLIANDSYAMSFQSMGQYRTALLKALNTEAPTTQPAPGEVGVLVKWLEEEAEAYSQTCGTNLASVNLDRAAALLEQLSDLAADAVAGMRYIEQSHGRLYGVGWDRVYTKAAALNPQLSAPAMPESLLRGLEQARKREFVNPPDLVEDEKLAAEIPD